MTSPTPADDDLCCAHCNGAWGDVRPCCTLTTNPRKTYCTDCCARELHDLELHDTDESVPDVWHG